MWATPNGSETAIARVHVHGRAGNEASGDRVRTCFSPRVNTATNDPEDMQGSI